MQGNKRKSINFQEICLLVISLIIVLFVSKPLQAQSDNQPEIDFKANKERLSIVLYKLSSRVDINFTYNSSEEVFDKEITYEAINKQPLVILEELLSSTSYTYKQVGNQIVIFRKSKDDNANPKHNNVVVASSGYEKEKSYRIVRDTVTIQDTILVIQTDTITITDTVFIEKDKPKKPTFSKIKEIPSDFFNPSEARENGWSANLFVVPILSNFSFAQDDGTLSFRNFSFGIEISKILKNWNISGGLKLTQFSEKFNHSYVDDDGGFYLTDTIDTYYTVVQNDTSWYYITDSTWKPVDSREYSYNVNNRVGYIEFAASLSFDYISNRNFKLYFKVGAQAGILVYKSGLAITNESKPEGINFADLNFRSSSYSILLGTGIKYRINKQFDFNTEVYYMNYFNDMVVNYPDKNKIQGIGIKLGLIYYF